MKQLLLMVVLLFVVTINAQKFSINVGLDPKLLLFGTDNEYTDHNSTINAHFKVEYHGRENELYFAIGIEYADLREEYRAWFADFGVPIIIPLYIFKEDIEILFIPQVEIGNIFREHIQIANFDSIKWDDRYYYGINISFRYKITDWFATELEGSVDRAVDLPNRDFRYGGKWNLIIYL